jgi:hypothetical protein
MIRHWFLVSGIGFTVAFFPHCLLAQVVSPNFGRSPNLDYYGSPSIESDRFQLDTGIICPTPSLTIGGFGGSGNDSSRLPAFPDVESRNDIDNFAVGAAVRFPFGGSLAQFCKEYAKSKADFEKTRVENWNRNAQLSLIQQCHWLRVNGFDLSDSSFDTDQFSTLKACRNAPLANKVKILDPRSGSAATSLKEQPVESNTKGFAPPSTVIQNQGN